MNQFFRSMTMIALASMLAACGKNSSTGSMSQGSQTYSVPMNAKSSNQWSNYSIPSSNAQSTVEFDLTPDQNQMDATVSLSSGPASASHEGEIRFHLNANGDIEAYDGTQFKAQASIQYHQGQPIHFKVDFDSQTKTYNATVSENGQADIQLASNYSFSSDSSADFVINNLGLQANSGEEDVDNFSVTVDLQLDLQGTSSGDSSSASATASASANATLIPGLLASANLCGQQDSLSVQGTNVYKYSLDVNLTGIQATFHMEIDGKDASGPLLAVNSSAQFSADVEVSGELILTQGPHDLKVVLDSGDAVVSQVQFQAGP